MNGNSVNDDENTEHREGWYNVSLTVSEFDELIWLIDDEPVDEEVLKGIRRKLVSKRRQARRRAS